MRTPFFIFMSIFMAFTGCKPKSKDIASADIPKSYICYQPNGQIHIDGMGNEPDWQAAAWTDDFIDIEGADKPAPRFRTRTKMLWDDNYLYVLAQLFEPHVWGTLHQRDTIIFLDNDFEVFIDPDGDTHHYYEYEINALGTEWDLKLDKPYRDGGPANSSWDIEGVRSAVSVQGTLNNPADTDTSWTVEVAFPLEAFGDSAVKVPPADGEQWRINLLRVQWKTKVENGKYIKAKEPGTEKTLTEDYWVWTSQDEISMHKPEKWGYLQFSHHTTESQTALFKYNPDENLKFYLRSLYYEQAAYYKAHKNFMQSLEESHAFKEKEMFDHYRPTMELTRSGYLIEAYSPDTKHKWNIDQSGRVWKSH